MKGIDIFCASQAATAILRTMADDDPSSSSAPSTAVLLGGGSSSPAIDRCNPIIADSRRSSRPHLPPPPIPKTHKNRKKKKQQRINEKSDEEVSRRKSWSCTKPGDFISPPGSTRYLLSEKVLLSEFPSEPSKVVLLSEFPPEPVEAEPASTNQVVVLRVSLHCRGCEKKMRKHISRMEGVSSFNIDFAAKKVTVTGNVTPLEVLSSISKVKTAQLWSPSLASSSPMNLKNNAWDHMDKVTFAGISS